MQVKIPKKNATSQKCYSAKISRSSNGFKAKSAVSGKLKLQNDQWSAKDKRTKKTVVGINICKRSNDAPSANSERCIVQ